MRLLAAALLCFFPVTAAAQDAPPPDEPTTPVDIMPIRAIKMNHSILRLSPPRKPLSLQVSIGGEAGRISDPFAYQAETTAAGAPAGMLNACKWLFCLEAEQVHTRNGEWKRSSVRLRTHIHGSSPSLGILIDGRRASWRRASYEDASLRVGTQRATTTALLGLEVGRGPFVNTSPRLTILYGYAEDRRDSWLAAGSFASTEALARNPAWVAGARVESSVTILGWFRISGELTYLHPTDQRKAYRLDDEWSARCIVTVPASKRFSVFGDLRYTADSPILMPESSVGFGIRFTR